MTFNSHSIDGTLRRTWMFALTSLLLGCYSSATPIADREFRRALADAIQVVANVPARDSAVAIALLSPPADSATSRASAGVRVTGISRAQGKAVVRVLRWGKLDPPDPPICAWAEDQEYQFSLRNRRWYFDSERVLVYDDAAC